MRASLEQMAARAQDAWRENLSQREEARNALNVQVESFREQQRRYWNRLASVVVSTLTLPATAATVLAALSTTLRF